VVIGSVSPAEAWDRLRHLGPVIADLERTGQTEEAAAVRLARELAESALRGDQHTEPSALLTTRQAGRVLGVSIQTIRNWVAAGRLPAEKRGVRTMIPRQAVRDEIERSRARPFPAIDEDARTLARRQQLLAGLPANLVRPLDALHDKMERGESLSQEEQDRMAALEGEMIAAAARVLAGDAAA